MELKPTTTQLEYLVSNYWLHYYPELSFGKWASLEVNSKAEIVERWLHEFERTLLHSGLLLLNKVDLNYYADGIYRYYEYFEWRLEISDSGAAAVERLCPMELILNLGEILLRAEEVFRTTRLIDLYSRRPRTFILDRVMRHISIAELPELISHEHKFIRQIAASRLMETAN